MSDLLILRALLFAGECVLASLLLPLLGFAITALQRRRAALRHLVWTTLFGVLALLPVAALLLPPRQIVEHAAAPAADTAPATMPVVAAPMMPPPPPSLFTLENALLFLVTLWLVGLAWQALRLGVGGLGLLRLRRRSTPFALEIETGCDVRLAAGEDGPSTFGILRPLILLPRSAPGWPATRLDAVLRHEAAHVARRDSASQLLARLVCALYWPNPLLWLAARALRRDAEIAADDAVLASGFTPSLYAAELVRLAADSRGIASPIPLGLAMATPPLTQRVQSILQTTTTRTGVSRMDIARTVCFGLAATLLLGVARFDIAVAQDASPRTLGAPVAPAAAPVAPVPPMDETQLGAQARARATADKAKAKADAERSYGEERQKGAEARARAAADKAEAAERAAKSYAEERDGAKQAMERANADKARAEDMRQRADVVANRVGDPTLSERERIAASQDLAERALARTADAFAQQAQMLKGSGDAGKQQLNQLAADSIALARQELAQARSDAARPGHAEASASSSSDSSVAINGTTSQQGNETSRMRAVSRYSNSRDGVQIDIRVDPAIDAANTPEVRNALRVAVDEAMAEARTKIATAIAAARGKAGLPTAPVAPVPSVRPILPVPR